VGLVLSPVFKDNSSGAVEQAGATAANNVPPKLQLYQASITISSRGFSPASVTVKKGDSVAWLNKDRAMHLIVSDSSAFAFKGQGSLSFSDMYLVTFTTAGTYTYHDMLTPSLKGTIIVE